MRRPLRTSLAAAAAAAALALTTGAAAAAPDDAAAPTVVVDGRDTGVPDRLLPSGARVSGALQLDGGWASRPAFQRHVVAELRDLRAAGVLSGREASAVRSAAARSADGTPGSEQPPRGRLTMAGDVGDLVPGVVDDPVHDPTLFEHDGTYYVASTGIADADDPGGVFLRRSTGSLEGPWESLGAVPLPAWTRAYDVGHLWAPHLVERDGVVHLYYSASSFGTNTSAIGHASTRTPEDLESWVDSGPVLTSGPGDPYNAIDPQVYVDRSGTWRMAFGSFWTGLQVVEMASMTETTGPVTNLARHPEDPPNPIENPQVFARGGYWYLTAAWDLCCRGVDSTYRTVVGRSTSPTGPFVDRDGVPLLEGGGTVLLDRRGDQVGPGALDVLEDRGLLYAVHHYYDAAADGVIRMQVREVGWEDGWPVVPGED
ncbi:arabinan endo-1,5-alpha-L-arabinosidase [Pseudokineococcus lusitanus]|uniref:Arabinan endo-1,5-alpha-L-arabinosidase n=1 Tax=Pseudokineococcus lusitanus TaxID=763993 RepID=A0A3N1GX01_9ACTN|nr:arabinan endo-1,5-alpha-L-arabinosidase [Pseudokineococcus lusitanus]ROP34770.1 arabinan endo-1,5-alpha-L-arabinosidase [Pseudokineococcus lusitanus]